MRDLLHNTVICAPVFISASSPGAAFTTQEGRTCAKTLCCKKLPEAAIRSESILLGIGSDGDGSSDLGRLLPATLTHSHCCHISPLCCPPWPHLPPSRLGPAASGWLPASGQGGDDNQGGRDDVAGAAALGPGGREGAGVMGAARDGARSGEEVGGRRKEEGPGAGTTKPWESVRGGGCGGGVAKNGGWGRWKF